MGGLVIGRRTLDLTGQKYGRLTVIRYAGMRSGRTIWLCRCICGVEKTCLSSNLIVGDIKSCGCLVKDVMRNRKTHGLTNHPLYKIYHGMMNRCYNPNYKASKNYINKGVKVCKEWRNNFLSFYNWCINNGWKQGLKVDKDIMPRKLGIAPKLYSPSTCSLVTQKQNSRTKANSIMVEFMGETKCLTEWCEIYGVNYSTLKKRFITQKYPFDKALEMSKSKKYRKDVYNPDFRYKPRKK